MSYNVDSEIRIAYRTGPFGIFKHERQDSINRGQLTEGSSLELFSRGGERWGMAKLSEDVLEVTPEGDVVVDMGNYRGFQTCVEIPNVDDKIEVQKIWVGSLKTTGDLTVRTTDSRESIKFHRVLQ